MRRMPFAFLSQFMPTGLTGLTVVSIDGRWLRLLHATGRSAHRTITALLAHPIEGLRDEEVTAWLKAACAASGVEAGAILLANPSYLTTTRLFTLPSTDSAEIRDIVELQAEKHTPYAKEEILTDFQVIEADRAGYSRVLLAISHQDVVHRGLRLVEGMGWTLERVGFELEGLVQWAGFAPAEAAPAEGALLVAEVDQDTTTVMLLHQGKPYVHRSLALGLAQLLDAPLEGAAKLSAELQQTVETFEAEGVAAALGRVVLTGQALRVPQLAEQVQQHVNVPTVSLSSFERCALAPGLVPDGDPLHQVAWASLAGLALGRSEVDLTPPSMKLHRAFEIRTRALVGAAYQVIALLLLSACVIMGQSFKSERYYSGLVRQHALRSQEIQELERLVERLAIVKEWQRGQGQLLEAVADLEAHTPAAIQWDTLTYAKHQQLTLKGVSTEMPKVFEFAEVMKLSPLFTRVEAKRVTKRTVEDQDVTEFELVCALAAPEDVFHAHQAPPGG